MRIGRADYDGSSHNYQLFAGHDILVGQVDHEDVLLGGVERSDEQRRAGEAEQKSVTEHRTIREITRRLVAARRLYKAGLSDGLPARPSIARYAT